MTGGTGGQAGHGGGGGVGGQAGQEGGAGGEGGTSGGGGHGGGSEGPACNLLDLANSGERCEACVGDALEGPCASTVNACAFKNPAALLCATNKGCMRASEDPPVDLGCMAIGCQAELLQLNACLIECDEYAACFL